MAKGELMRRAIQAQPEWLGQVPTDRRLPEGRAIFTGCGDSKPEPEAETGSATVNVVQAGAPGEPSRKVDPNATPVTDGQRVIVMFGTVGVLAAYDFDGKELWRRDVGVIEASDPQAGAAQWGHASSPILYRDLVIVQADRVKDSYLAAFRAATGEPVWRVARDEPSTWSTPNVVRADSGSSGARRAAISSAMASTPSV